MKVGDFVTYGDGRQLLKIVKLTPKFLWGYHYHLGFTPELDSKKAAKLKGVIYEKDPHNRLFGQPATVRKIPLKGNVRFWKSYEIERGEPITKIRRSEARSIKDEPYYSVSVSHSL